MQIKKYQEVCLAVLNQFIYGEYDINDFKDIIDPKIFGGHAIVAKFLQTQNKEKIIKDGVLSTDFIKEANQENLGELISEVMLPTYYSFDIFRDLEFIIKNYHEEKNEGDIYQLVEKVKEKQEKLKRMKSSVQSSKYQLSKLFDKIADDAHLLSKKTGILGYSTGIPSIDKYTEGLQKGTVMRLTAYSNIGKSKFSYHVCNSILKQGAYVLYFSLEVKKETVVHNLMMNWYNKDYFYCTRGKWLDETNFDSSSFFSKSLEVVDDMYELSQILRYTKDRNPDVVFIDFVQNIQTGLKTEYEEMTEVAKQIQQLAITKNIAVFDLSQVANDGVRYVSGGKIPSKGSGALVASADVNMVMERDTVDSSKNLLFLAKNKFGMNGKCIELEMNFSTNQIKDLGEKIPNSKPISKV